MLFFIMLLTLTNTYKTVDNFIYLFSKCSLISIVQTNIKKNNNNDAFFNPAGGRNPLRSHVAQLNLLKVMY